MFRAIFDTCRKFRFGFCCFLTAGLICFGSSGCAKWNLRGESYPEDSMTTGIKQARQSTPKAEVWSYSNKARQIEEDCGAH
jgi:hypothetical protein